MPEREGRGAAWADFFLAPVGGGLLGLLLWYLLKEPCPLGAGFYYECVRFGDAVMPPGWAATAGTVLGLAIGAFIHMFREK